MEEELDLDTLLAVIGNPTRRQILRKLVKETHYPLQLSKELSISQQAIMKHLEVLEKHELVKSVFQESESGPPRRCYVATRSLTIIIDLAPELFSEELRIHEASKEKDAGKKEKQGKTMDSKKLKGQLAELSEGVSEINVTLRALAEERDALIAEKESAMLAINRIVHALCDDYTERKVLAYLISEDEFSLPVMAEKLNMREAEVEKVIRKLEEEGLLIFNE
jgi:predicted transcriptional regulator